MANRVAKDKIKSAKYEGKQITTNLNGTNNFQ